MSDKKTIAERWCNILSPWASPIIREEDYIPDDEKKPVSIEKKENYTIYKFKDGSIMSIDDKIINGPETIFGVK